MLNRYRFCLQRSVRANVRIVYLLFEKIVRRKIFVIFGLVIIVNKLGSVNIKKAYVLSG